MATSQAQLIHLKQYLQEFKSSMRFRNCDSNAEKIKIFESVRKNLAKVYEDEPGTLGLTSVSENPYKDLNDVNEI